MLGKQIYPRKECAQRAGQDAARAAHAPAARHQTEGAATLPLLQGLDATARYALKPFFPVYTRATYDAVQISETKNKIYTKKKPTDGFWYGKYKNTGKTKHLPKKYYQNI